METSGFLTNIISSIISAQYIVTNQINNVYATKKYVQSAISQVATSGLASTYLKNNQDGILTGNLTVTKNLTVENQINANKINITNDVLYNNGISLIQTIKDLSGKVSGAATGLKITKTTTGLPSTVATEYKLVNKDGEQLGQTITIYKDQYLSGAVYDQTTKNLTLVFYTASGTTTSATVNLSGLIDTYYAASGITSTKVNGYTTFIGKLDSETDKYLTITENGFLLSGVTPTFNKINNNIDYVSSVVTGLNKSLTSAFNNIDYVSGVISSAINIDPYIIISNNNVLSASNYKIGNDTLSEDKYTVATEYAVSSAIKNIKFEPGVLSVYLRNDKDGVLTGNLTITKNLSAYSIIDSLGNILSTKADLSAVPLSTSQLINNNDYTTNAVVNNVSTILSAAISAGVTSTYMTTINPSGYGNFIFDTSLDKPASTHIHTIGLRGYYFEYFDFSNFSNKQLTIYLTSAQVFNEQGLINQTKQASEFYDSSFECKYSVSDQLSMKNKFDHPNFFTITNIDGNKIEGIVNFANQGTSDRFYNASGWIADEGTDIYQHSLHCQNKPTIGLNKISENGISFGYTNAALAQGATAIGKECLAMGKYSLALGRLTSACTYGSFTHGYKTTVKTGTYAHAEGQLTIAIGSESHAEGHLTITNGKYSHAEGQSTSALIDNSHAEGLKTVAAGVGSHTEGSATSAYNYGSHAEGYSTIASGNYSHAEGHLTVTNGHYSHAEGQSTSALIEKSHSEGLTTLASGIGAHAEGSATSAYGWGTHAEGLQTMTSGNYAHAEGSNTICFGSQSHAEGYKSKTYEFYAHAEGSATSAYGMASHAEGLGTITSANYQHVEGQYNEIDSNKLFIIGNGSSDTNRSNALTVDKNGNEILAGNLTFNTNRSLSAELDALKPVYLSGNCGGTYNLDINTADNYGLILTGNTIFNVNIEENGTGIAVKCKNPSGYTLTFNGEQIITAAESGTYYFGFIKMMNSTDLVVNKKLN